MKSLKLLAAAGLFGLGVVAGSLALAESKETKAPEMKLPPGWTAEDVQKCMEAGTPGKMHQVLAKSAGTWTGKCTMWMGPDGEQSASDATATCEPLMDGRYLKVDWKGEMGGMPYHGSGIYAYDNVAKQFQCTWFDNTTTGLLNGTGELSPDGKTFTWKINFSCPITGKAATMRQIETITGEKTKTLDMWAPDPKSGKEYKVMRVEFTKK